MSGWEPTHAFLVGEAAPFDRDVAGFSDSALGRRYGAKWCATPAIAVDALKAGHHKHGGLDVGLRNSCESEPIERSLVDGEWESALGNGPSSAPLKI
jgi:hypothetical protein